MEDSKPFQWRDIFSLDRITEKIESWAAELYIMLPNVLVAVLALFLFYLIANIVKSLVRRVFSRFSDQVALINLFSTLSYLLIIIFGLFVALNVLQLEQTVSSLLAGAGIVGLALGFAFQDISVNFISGILIAFRKPFHVGDMIESNGYAGVVEEINLRATILKTLQGLHVIIPNKDIIQTPMTNYTLTTDRRVDLAVGVSYGDSLDQVEAVTKKAVENVPLLKSTAHIDLFFEEFGDSSINLLVVFWLTKADQGSYLRARSEAVKAIKAAYDAHDITIPFPIRTLDFGIKGGEKLSEIKINSKNF